MYHLDRCVHCNSDRVKTRPGPSGFTSACLKCGATQELDDLLEPLAARPAALSVGVGQMVAPAFAAG